MARLVGYDMTNVQGEVRILDNDVYKASFSSKPTYLVETDDNAEVISVDGTIAVPEKTTALIDVKFVGGKMLSWNVRDKEVGNDLVLGSLHTPAWFRRFCEERGAATKYVAGGCYPINPSGFTCVDCYNMSGTEYFLVPNHVINEFVSKKLLVVRTDANSDGNCYYHM